LNLRNKTLKKLLKLDVSVLNNLEKENVLPCDIATIRRMIADKVEVTEENLRICGNRRYPFVMEFFKTRNIPVPAKLIKYLKAQRLKADNKNVCGDYCDYLGECEKLKFDLTDKQVLFPKDLLAAHERTSGLAQEEANPYLAKKMKNASKRWAFADFAAGEYAITGIKTLAALKAEAMRMKNCSYGYAQRIADGESVIFVIRRAAAPDEAFFRLEIDPKKIEVVQNRGVNNGQGEAKAYAELTAWVNGWLNTVVKPGVKRERAKAAKREQAEKREEVAE
jgi:hypothetical protein